MALSLGVREGMLIRIGQDIAEVKKVYNPQLIDVVFNGATHQITALEKTCIATDVYLSCGLAPNMTYMPRLLIDAPQALRISRGTN